MPVVLNRLVAASAPVTLRNGAIEYKYKGAFLADTILRLQVKFRLANDNPVVRFCYTLKATKGQILTKKSENDDLTYLSYSTKDFLEAKEIRLSVFNEMIHSCNLSGAKIYEADFANSDSFVGPILLGSNGLNTFLCAYEHDAKYQNNFLEYRLLPDKNVALHAVRGNYYPGQPAEGYSDGPEFPGRFFSWQVAEKILN